MVTIRHVHIIMDQMLAGLKGKSAYELRGPSGQSLSKCQLHEAFRSISTPPGWDASSSHVNPRH